jgi:beta-lactam-binding protein with PASTA domain
MYDEQQWEYQAPPSRRPAVVAAIFASLLTSGAAFFGLRWAERNGHLGGSAPAAVVVDVPNLVGMSTGDAREALKGRGLLIVLESERDDAKVPAGAIAAQAPLPGSQLHQGSTVRAVVSRGLSQQAVPSVVGESVEAASRRLAEAGLKTGASRAAPNDAPEGTVVATAPPAGAMVIPGTAVELTVSAGKAPETKPVPKLTGLRLSKAKTDLAAAGFTLGKVRYDYDADRGGNVVLRQEPAEGAAVAPGSAIDLVVNEP